MRHNSSAKHAALVLTALPSVGAPSGHSALVFLSSIMPINITLYVKHQIVNYLVDD